MADYTDEHACALADIKDAGSSVTFTGVTQTINPETGAQSAPVNTTVEGWAIRVTGNPKVYELLGLVQSKAPTLLFAPTTFGDDVDLGAKVTWDGAVYYVRDVAPVAPDGNTIIARIVIGL